MTKLFVATDVHYLSDTQARAAMVAAREPAFAQIAWTRTEMVVPGAPYQPGEFYRRELPALRAVLPTPDDLALIIVDGYVDLDPDGRPGLGAHVHAEYQVPVIGVAKTPFQAATHAAPVRRGQSRKPLYITAAGLSITEAGRLVTAMAGEYWLPDALKLADHLACGPD
jgi:deoxyribonuclease V